VWTCDIAVAGALQEINENVEERINLQKALFELEDINVCNQYELQNIEDMLKAGAARWLGPAAGRLRAALPWGCLRQGETLHTDITIILHPCPATRPSSQDIHVISCQPMNHVCVLYL
jgi:hypothetical protein